MLRTINSTLGFFKFFRTSSGISDMTLAGAGSTSPITFFVEPSTANSTKRNKHVALERVTLQMIDGGITPPKFGGITGSTKGVYVQIQTSTGGLVFDFMDGDKIRTNQDWGLLAGVDDVLHPAAGDDGLHIRWTIQRGFGDAVLLKQGQRLVMKSEIASSGLSSWTMMAQGSYVSG